MQIAHKIAYDNVSTNDGDSEVDIYFDEIMKICEKLLLKYNSEVDFCRSIDRHNFENAYMQYEFY